MTTKVIIKAQVSKQKEVKVIVRNLSDSSLSEVFMLQDGEVAERYIFDAHEIAVKEVYKPAYKPEKET